MIDEQALFEAGNLFQYEPAPQTKAERLRKMARQADPQTSWEAALAVLPHVGGQKKRILELLSNEPQGLTVSQICQRLSLEKPSVSKRCSELEKSNHLEIIGVRPTNTGKNGSIYRIKGDLYAWREGPTTMFSTELQKIKQGTFVLHFTFKKVEAHG